MELVNAKRYTDEDTKILMVDFRENDEIVATLSVDKYIFDSTKSIFEELDKEEKVTMPGPCHQTITITSYTDQDMYTSSESTIQESHHQTVKKVSALLASIIGINPTYTRDSLESGIESEESYSARLITEIDVIAILMRFLHENKVIVEEEDSLINGSNIHKL